MNWTRPALRRCLRVRRALLVGTMAIAALAAPLATGAASAATGASSGTVIVATDGAFGPMLVVGSGPYAGYSLYAITGDHGHHFACTAKVVNVLGHPGSCTGPSNDPNAEWPALTTTGAPVAGPGVDAGMLGAVHRPGVGEQVTYNGHPLYLFDQSPGIVSGEGWDEPSLPPWHGVWWVVSPSGAPQPWTATLTTLTVRGHRVLGVDMIDGGGTFVFPVYAYSRGTSCTGACAALWAPSITQGSPGVAGGLSRRYVSTVARADGTRQLTYKGRALYLYTHEKVLLSATGFALAGNGAGKHGPAPFGGRFSLVRG